MSSIQQGSPDEHDTAATAPMVIRARGRSFLALVLAPERPIAEWVVALDAQIERSRGFFAGKPVILDLSLLEADDEGLPDLQSALLERGVRLVGIEGANPDWPALAAWDWPEALQGGRASGAVDLPADEDHQSGDPSVTGDLSSSQRTVIWEENIRSGQSVMNLEGDLVVLGSVASGAEIAASGSIHVYGTLRGRAVAGVGGQSEARVFARRMDAELIAVDGYYMTAEEMGDALAGASAQAFLQDERIVVRPLA